MAKKKIDSGLFTAILYIVVGILLAVFPGEAISIAMTIVGVVFIISGILELIKGNVLGGIISLIIGVAILVLGWAHTEIVMLVLGILIAIKGIISLIGALKRKKKSVLQIIFAVLTIALGILLAFAFGDVARIITIVGGILLAISGVIGLIGCFKK
jgi:uncharacterized membrane protein HdeD (DUF308 family)